MMRNFFWVLIALLGGMFFMFALVSYTTIIPVRGTAKIKGEIATLTKIAAMREKHILKIKQDLNTCQGAYASKEASLEDFYQELIYADRIDVTAFSGDGPPRRLIFDCEGRKQ